MSRVPLGTLSAWPHPFGLPARLPPLQVEQSYASVDMEDQFAAIHAVLRQHMQATPGALAGRAGRGCLPPRQLAANLMDAQHCLADRCMPHS